MAFLPFWTCLIMAASCIAHSHDVTPADSVQSLPCADAGTYDSAAGCSKPLHWTVLYGREERSAYAETPVEVLGDGVLLQGLACLNYITAAAVASSCTSKACRISDRQYSQVLHPVLKVSCMRQEGMHACGLLY